MNQTAGPSTPQRVFVANNQQMPDQNSGIQRAPMSNQSPALFNNVSESKYLSNLFFYLLKSCLL